MTDQGSRGARWLAIAVPIAVALALALRRSRTYAVEGDSMRPALEPGDYVHAWPWPHPLPLPVGALVVASPPDQPALSVIKRLRGLGADGTLRLAGDNPDASTDSRHYGSVARSRLEGLVWLRYWPPGRLALLLPDRLHGDRSRPRRRPSPLAR